MRAIILAAGVGGRLKPETGGTPKCLLQIGAQSLLRRHIEALRALGIPEAVLIVGHPKEKIAAETAGGPADVVVRLIENTPPGRGNILSLWTAREELDDDILLMDGDVFCPQELLARLLASADPNAIAVDEGFRDAGEAPKVICEDEWVVEVSREARDDPRIRGEAVGFLRLSADAALVLRGILEELVRTGKDALEYEYESAFRELAAEVPIGVVEVGDLPWIRIDLEEDLALARQALLPRVEELDRSQILPAP